MATVGTASLAWGRFTQVGSVAVVPPILTPRTLLRPVTADDHPALVSLRTRPDVARWWGPLVELETDGLAVVHESRVVGMVQWEEETDPCYRSAGIDLYLDPALHGRGLGTEVVRSVAQHLVEARGHHRLTIDPAADNVAAVACYRKVGFRPVGVMRQYELDATTGLWRDGLLMELLAKDLTTPGSG